MNEFPLLKNRLRLGLMFYSLVALPIYADTSDDAGGGTTNTDTNLEEATIIECEPASDFRLIIRPDNQIFIEKNSLEKNSIEDSLKITQLVKLPLKDELNPHKTIIGCLPDQKFQITTSPPYSNRLIKIDFSIKETKLSIASNVTETTTQESIDSFEIVIGKRSEFDPTEQLLEKAKLYAITGNNNKLNQLDLSHIDFAYQYVNADRVVSIIKDALTACEQRRCKPVLLTTFELITRLSYSISDTKRDAQSSLSLISALDDLGVPITDSAPIFLRYIEILRNEGKIDQSLEIVSEMVRREAPIAELYLVYGDLLWQVGNTEEAKNQYRNYVQLISQNGQPPIPRVARLLE
ncbi:MAG: hypothetical protein H3C43_00060 [Leptonema sp. (in: Bacteria)]|nr:hypothetical protein [Leptonema sp. (in: bacteria)]